jgi:hypothetical protein
MATALSLSDKIKSRMADVATAGKQMKAVHNGFPYRICSRYSTRKVL